MNALGDTAAVWEEGGIHGNIDAGVTVRFSAKDICRVEYQPIIDCTTGEPYGYEALARFEIEGEIFPAGKLFFMKGNTPESYHELEKTVKKYQVKHRPEGQRLFLNISPFVIAVEAYCRYWVDFFSKHENIVVEIAEHISPENSKSIERFTRKLDEANIPYALDDVFQNETIFFPELFIKTNIIKLDRSFLRMVESNEKYLEFLRGIVNFCNMDGKKLIIEGAETENDMELIRKLNIPYAQGYIHRELFIVK